MRKEFDLNDVTCVILTGDDVLLPGEPLFYEARKAAFRAVGNHELAETFTMEQSEKFSVESPAQLFAAPEFLEKSKTASDAYYAEYFRLAAENKLFPETEEFLQRLGAESFEKNFSIVLLTRKTHTIVMEELERFGILKYFDRVLGSLRIKEIDKPNVRAFENATAGLDTSNTIMVGPPKDALFAEKCGVKFFELPRPAQQGEGIKILLDAIK